MMLRHANSICMFGKHVKNNLPILAFLINSEIPNNSFKHVRTIKKHFNPKFRKERGKKFIKIELPKFNMSEEMQQEEFRSRMKQMGILPQRTWNERPILITATPNIFEPYVVPEGDGKFSPITKVGAKQKVEYIEKKSKSFMAIRRIKTYDELFSSKIFPETALEIYKKAHEALVTKDENQLLQYVTETAYPLMIHNILDKTVVWKFLESLEPAHIVHARVTKLISDENQFAQVTIRFHTQQLLCIYDRFGRHLLGSETVKKDVLDYVVFERHLSNLYGTWRIHGKIVPEWMAPQELPGRTFIAPKEEVQPSNDEKVESVADTVSPDSLNENQPAAKT